MTKVSGDEVQREQGQRNAPAQIQQDRFEELSQSAQTSLTEVLNEILKSSPKKTFSFDICTGDPSSRVSPFHSVKGRIGQGSITFEGKLQFLVPDDPSAFEGISTEHSALIQAIRESSNLLEPHINALGQQQCEAVIRSKDTVEAGGNAVTFNLKSMPTFEDGAVIRFTLEYKLEIIGPITSDPASDLPRELLNEINRVGVDNERPPLSDTIKEALNGQRPSEGSPQVVDPKPSEEPTAKQIPMAPRDGPNQNLSDEALAYILTIPDLERDRMHGGLIASKKDIERLGFREGQNVLWGDGKDGKPIYYRLDVLQGGKYRWNLNPFYGLNITPSRPRWKRGR